ncbi:MAG: hypothetical protein AB1810_02775 [Pseudomonadota bacterium]
MKYVVYTLAAICAFAGFTIDLSVAPNGRAAVALSLLPQVQAAKKEFKELDDISILFEEKDADYTEEDPAKLFRQLPPAQEPAQPVTPPTVPAPKIVAPEVPAPRDESAPHEPPAEASAAVPPAAPIEAAVTKPAETPAAAGPEAQQADGGKPELLDTQAQFPLINPEHKAEENLEYDPYWNVPDAVKYIAAPQLLDAWVALHETKDKQATIKILREYALANKKVSSLPTQSQYSKDFVFDLSMFNDSKVNSFAFQLLLAKVNMLKNITEHDSELYDDKGLFWYAKGLEKVYQQKALHARVSFVRGILSAAELGPESFQQLNYAGIDIAYDPGMSKYVNSARLANKFMELPLDRQEIVLNIALADKMFDQPVNKEEVGDTHSPTYKMLSILFNLGAYIKTERSFNYGANAIFTDEEYDLYRILAEKFGFHTIDLIEIGRLGEKKQP